METKPMPHRETHEASSSQETDTRRPKVIGNEKSFWLWSAEEGFDLTHPPTPSSEPIRPRIRMGTANAPITISPAKTALIIIDMQNLFLARPLVPQYEGHDAEEVLLRLGIPAARKAGIQIIWLNWGLSEDDLKTAPPTVMRTFGFNNDGTLRPGREVGVDLGQIKLDSGEVVQGGRLLMRNQWNTELHGGLEAAFQDGLKAARPDLLFHKNRISGMCDAMTDCTDYLLENGFTTLLFTGVNTDICVLGTLQDANSKGFDTVLLKDGCGTPNGESAKVATERSCSRPWGFLSSCEQLWQGVETMEI